MNKSVRLSPTEREIHSMSDESILAEFELIKTKTSSLSSMKRSLISERADVILNTPKEETV